VSDYVLVKRSDITGIIDLFDSFLKYGVASFGKKQAEVWKESLEGAHTTDTRDIIALFSTEDLKSMCAAFAPYVLRDVAREGPLIRTISSILAEREQQ
jgi:hypothetical protein